jgi:heme a synthase
MVVAAMIVAMVLVGGATRLTESGLSITEWKPVTGTLPPLTEAHWHEAFEAYKKIPQYRELNHGMSLAEFKNIFWWEWSHRLLGRTIGMVFLLPFLFFLWRRKVPSAFKKPLWVIFALGGLQGFVGWWMVASGLTHRVEVSQYRLAVHLMLALIIFAAIVWVLRRMSAGTTVLASARLRVTSWVLLGLTFLQIYFGALVAGLRAGRVFNTWPDIDGTFIPSAARLFFEDPWWRNMFDNALTVQFQHRMTAYLLFAVAIWHALDALLAKADRSVVNGALWLVATIAVQAMLGIMTLLQQVPIDLALMHQGVAIVVLTLAILQVERMKERDVPQASHPLGLAIGLPSAPPSS